MNGLPWRTCVVGDAKTGQAVSTHVVPEDDLRQHESDGCWCRPTQEAECPSLWIHNSMDGREAFEAGDRLPS